MYSNFAAMQRDHSPHDDIAIATTMQQKQVVHQDGLVHKNHPTVIVLTPLNRNQERHPASVRIKHQQLPKVPMESCVGPGLAHDQYFIPFYLNIPTIHII